MKILTVINNSITTLAYGNEAAFNIVSLIGLKYENQIVANKNKAFFSDLWPQFISKPKKNSDSLYST